MAERMKEIHSLIFLFFTHLKLMRGAEPGRGRLLSAAPTRRSMALSPPPPTPRPPSTPSFTSSLIYAAERGRKKARQTDGPTLQHRWLAFLLSGLWSLPGFHFTPVSRSPFNALGCCDESTDLPRNSAVIHFPRQRLGPERVRRVSRTIYRVGSYQSFHIIPRVSVEGWFP